jgi:hypothetical protein
MILPSVLQQELRLHDICCLELGWTFRSLTTFLGWAERCQVIWLCRHGLRRFHAPQLLVEGKEYNDYALCDVKFDFIFLKIFAFFY